MLVEVRKETFRCSISVLEHFGAASLYWNISVQHLCTGTFLILRNIQRGSHFYNPINALNYIKLRD